VVDGPELADVERFRGLVSGSYAVNVISSSTIASTRGSSVVG
jgi:hypothetical protein